MMSLADDDIAVIGMSCLVPGASNIDSFYQNLLNGVDAISVVPEHRIASRYFSNSAETSDQFYCRKGGFVDQYAHFDPLAFGITPNSIVGTEPEHLMTLKCAHQALEDANASDDERLLEKTGIILGKGNYCGTGMMRLIESVRTSEQIVEVLKQTLPHLKMQDIIKIKTAFKEQRDLYQKDAIAGLIPNLCASMVANRLNFHGPAYTLDAACASSLVALQHGIHHLKSKDIDMALIGGVHLCHDPSLWSVFTQLKALSHKECISPFDKNADGLLIGEACAFVVIRRLSDAIRAQQRIYAVIKGVGVSSDGKTAALMSPSVVGQTAAIRQAWAFSDLDPQKLGYLEAHGTATRVGDETEARTLSKIFPHEKFKNTKGIGSVKSMLGHTMPAAGMVGLIKTVLSLYHEKKFPTLHCHTPINGLKDSAFEPVLETDDWPSRFNRIAGVNAFGFGGINAHVVLMSHDHYQQRPQPKLKKKINIIQKNTKTIDAIVLARRSTSALISALNQQDFSLGEGKYRLAIYSPSKDKIQRALQIIQRDQPWRGRNDIWYTNRPLYSNGAKIAFLFPGLDGIGSSNTESLRELLKTTHFLSEAVRKELSPLSAFAWDILENSELTYQLLNHYGLKPDTMAGHSFGEWSAAFCSGMIDKHFLIRQYQTLSQEVSHLPDVKYWVLSISSDKAKNFIVSYPEIFISSDNCPQQCIICGPEDRLEDLKPFLRKEKIIIHALPFQSGFHTPYASHFVDKFKKNIRSIPYQKPNVPVWSATTLEPYPATLTAIQSLTVDHLLKPVRFQQLIKKLYSEKIRIFIQVGAGGLTGFVNDTLKGKDVISLSAGSAHVSPSEQISRVLLGCFVEGCPIDVEKLNGFSSLVRRLSTVSISLGLPLVSQFPVLTSGTEHTTQRVFDQLGDHPVASAFREQAEAMFYAHKDIAIALTAKKSRQTINPKIFIKKLIVSLKQYPELLDHSLIRQKRYGSSVERENFSESMPVVPFTMVMQLFADLALEIAPERKIIALNDIQVMKWIVVDKEIELIVMCEWLDEDCLMLETKGSAKATVIFRSKGKEVIKPPIQHFDLGETIEKPFNDDEIYQKILFHGPRYQGLHCIEKMAEKGVRASIKPLTALGALLDNAGQALGLWIHFSKAERLIAFPVKIEKIQFWSDNPQQDIPMYCECIVRENDPLKIVADLQLYNEDGLWASIIGWMDVPLEVDGPLWDVLIRPLEFYLSTPIKNNPEERSFDSNRFRKIATWEFIAKRYLNHDEMIEYEVRLNSDDQERLWLSSIVAAKDIIRYWLKKEINLDLYPSEIRIENPNNASPVFTVDNDRLRSKKLPEIILAQKDELGIARCHYESTIGS